MRTWLCCGLALFSGCIVPRSMVLGQMAAPVGQGATEVGVHSGVLWASQTNPTFETKDALGDVTRTAERTQAFAAPGFEANLQHGFSDHVALNVHGSSAGIQPGLKWTLNRSSIAHVALLPEVAFGYGSTLGETLVEGPDGVLRTVSPHSQTSFTFLGGLKFLFSHRSGFYAGVGYDFIFNRNYNASILGAGNVTDKQELVNQSTGHQITASVGFDIALGMVHLRPEVAFAAYPGLSLNVTSKIPPNENRTGATGGFGFAVFPGFSIAIATPKKSRAEVEAEDDEDDESDRVRSRSRRRSDDDEEDSNRARRTRKPVDDDD